MLIGVFIVTHFAAVFAGNKICNMLSRPVPFVIEKMQNTWKIQLGLSALVGSYFCVLYFQDAFEIYINNELKFSKIVTGRSIQDYDIRAIFADYGIKP